MLQLENMNELQKEIITTDTQVCAVEGRAGYGKTTLMLQRIHSLKEDKGISYKKMLNLCYGKDDIQMNKVLFQTYFPMEENTPLFTTLYSFCFGVIKKYNTIREIETPKPYRDLSSIVNRIIKEGFGYELNKEEMDLFMTQIAKCKTMMSEKELENFKLPEKDINALYVYKQYEKEKEKKKIMDFEDLLLRAMQILASDKDIRDGYQNVISHIHVDDAQNLPFMAHLVLKSLMKEDTQLHYYYDLDQVYAKRQAPFPEVFGSLETTFANVKRCKLDTNYRMDKSIDAFVRNFYYNEEIELEENANHSYKGFNTTEDLYVYALMKAQSKPSDLLYVCRNTEMFIPFIDLLEKNEVPFQMNTSVQSFFKHPIVSDIMSFFALLSNSRDLVAFREVSTKLKLNFSERAFAEVGEMLVSNPEMNVYQACIDSNIRSELKNRLRNWIEALRMAEYFSSTSAIKYIFDKLQYRRYLLEKKIHVSPTIMNVLYTMAARYSNMAEFNQRMKELQKVPALRSAAIVLDAADNLCGQEYEEVWILDCQEQYFPRVHDDEEKGYFYRSITRARKNVHFLFAKKYEDTRLRPSSYLLQMYKKETKVEVEAPVTAPVKPVQKYRKGSTIHHAALGKGVILEHDKAMAKTRFENGEVRVINLEFCKKNNLLLDI